MSHVPKKRDLFKRSGGVEPGKDNVCLLDITEVLGKMSAQASKLELQDNITSCKQSIELTFKLESLSKLYRERMRDVRNEIKVTNSKSGKYKGNVSTLNKINEKKS